MKSWMNIVVAAGVALAACQGHEQGKTAMQDQLNHIRVMVKQSALMAVEAACASPGERGRLIEAAAVMNRRAMGGPEMARIHRMMSMQPDESGSMNMKQKDEGMSDDMKQHVALHDAGEDVMDFLAAVSEGKLNCDQASAALLAANAAMLREAGGREADRAARALDARASARVASGGTPEAAKALALALRKL